MNHLVLFALLLLGIQAASGSARHLMSEFRGGKVSFGTLLRICASARFVRFRCMDAQL